MNWIPDSGSEAERKQQKFRRPTDRGPIILIVLGVLTVLYVLGRFLFGW
jgi:hypothetical protein